VRHFVQNFYDWYAPIARSDRPGPPSDVIAIKSRRSAFTTKLAKALEADEAAQAKVKGDIVGLDFDPFLASQDPGEHYEVGKVSRTGQVFWAEVHSVVDGKMSPKPDVFAEVLKVDGEY